MAGDEGPEKGTRAAVARKAHQDQRKSQLGGELPTLVSDSVVLLGFNLMDVVGQHSF